MSPRPQVLPERRCLHCHHVLLSQNPRAKFDSTRCRKAHWRWEERQGRTTSAVTTTAKTVSKGWGGRLKGHCSFCKDAHCFGQCPKAMAALEQ